MHNANRLSADELLILVDEKDNVLGYESKKECHEGQGLLHRAFSIFIFNDKNELLLQKRSFSKPLWPLYWSNSVCSHPRRGETYHEAARRRLREELGFETPLQALFKFQYQASFKNIGSENEICFVYIGKANGIVQTDLNEIAAWKYIDAAVLTENMLNYPNLYTPWFKMEWERIRKEYLCEIRNL